MVDHNISINYKRELTTKHTILGKHSENMFHFASYF